ncbi:HAD family hydrolase [Streptomyces sp. NPDC059740]|uniref:HAD family hydrolase n=1 Tax=Streptomyces sp. NPDC059740 TaxID=3346926 RepID=UPI003663FD07
MAGERQVLVFDADDTLWENNIVFERVVEEFLDWVSTPELARDGVRAVLDEVEAANIPVHGYGMRPFLRSLGDTLERLRGRPATGPELARVAEWAAAFERCGAELLPEVAGTLAELAGRHTLLMLTKGDLVEQRAKVAASGLERHFRDVRIVPEKDVAVYRELGRTHGFPAGRTWMVGNSPRSDIVPARAAGWNAVFIPHQRTWAWEEAALDPADPGVLRLNRFGELLDHF